jgi:hypothetical protein
MKAVMASGSVLSLQCSKRFKKESCATLNRAAPSRDSHRPCDSRGCDASFPCPLDVMAGLLIAMTADAPLTAATTSVADDSRAGAEFFLAAYQLSDPVGISETGGRFQKCRVSLVASFATVN